ncbi:MAG: hypothetical protein ACI9HK_001356, partial [Pirellulaceae bacterium]
GQGISLFIDRDTLPGVVDHLLTSGKISGKFVLS